jgi:hypothetical protein
MTEAMIGTGSTWSGSFDPAKGQTVKVGMNNLGEGTITDFFFEAGFKGVVVKLHNAPEWHQRQCPDHLAYVFGRECTLIEFAEETPDRWHEEDDCGVSNADRYLEELDYE